MTFNELLTDKNACEDAIIWASDKNIEEVVNTCYRGDWLLWLAKRVGVPSRELTLAKGHCANTVRHLMKDERSKKSVDAAIAYGSGLISEVELAAAAAYAYAADAAAAADADADADAAAAYAAACAAYAAADDAAAAACAAARTAACAAARTAACAKNQQQTADICRQYIGQLIIYKVNELLK